jgi:hypothetical protein
MAARKTMKRRRYLALASITFGLAAAFHLVRFLFGWPIRVGRHEVPRGSSVTGFLGAGALAAWGAWLAARDEE